MTLTDRKIARAFGQIDVDQSGQITRDDLLNLGARLLSAFGEPPTSPKGVAVTAGMIAFWENLANACDLDADDVIDYDEYHDAMEDVFVGNPEEFEGTFAPMITAVAALLDTDNDRYINLPEFTAALGVLVLPNLQPDEVEAIFIGIDTNGDEAISTDELFCAARDFYIGTDPTAVGNTLFGAL